MATAPTIMAVAAVVAAGAGVYAATQAGRGGGMPPAPKPAGSLETDDEGNVLTQQRWDPDKNAYVTEYDPEPKLENFNNGNDVGIWKAAHDKWEQRKTVRDKDNAIRTGLKNKALSKLNEGDPDRESQIQEYGKNFATAMHKDVDERFKEVSQQTEEGMVSRGLFGSKAYADAKAQLLGEKLAADTDIATQSEMAKEGLRESDRNYWMNILSSIDAKEKGDTLLQMERGKNAANVAGMGTASAMGAWNAENVGSMQRWDAKLKRNQEMINAGTKTASGLAYLYGYNKGGGTGAGIGGGTSNIGAGMTTAYA